VNSLQWAPQGYFVAFFLAARNFAQRARVASAILFLPAADNLRLAGAAPGFAITATGCEFFRRPAHRAFCANAILRRDAADTVRIGWAVLLGVAVYISFKDSISEITRSNLSISACAWLRLARSSLSALSKFDMINSLSCFDAANCTGVE
jgi:hypothetical protein